MNPYDKRNIGPREIFKISLVTDQIQSEWTKTGGGTAFEHPFQILDASSGATPKVNIRYGTMMDVVPTNVATDISLSAGTSYFYLKNQVDINGLFVGSVLITSGSSQPADDDTYGYITLGRAIVAGTSITEIEQAATHSLRMAVCGRTLSGGTAILDTGQYEFWGF